MGTRYLAETLLAFAQRSPLMMTDEHNFVLADSTESTAYRTVVAVRSVAVQFVEFVEAEVDVIEKLRAFGVP
jgi:hypothetical protein